jgi:hypothetical protein
VRVAGHEQRPVGALPLPVLADGLADGHDVVLVEGRAQAGAAVPGRAERDLLGRDRRVGVTLAVGRQQAVEVDEVGRLGGLAGRGLTDMWASSRLRDL